MGAVGIAISALALWICWPHAGFVRVAVIVLGLAYWWTFGIMHEAAFIGSRRFWNVDPELGADRAPDWVAWVSFGAFVAQSGLLIWGMFYDPSIAWWYTLPALPVLIFLLARLPALMVYFPILILLVWWLR